MNARLLLWSMLLVIAGDTAFAQSLDSVLERSSFSESERAQIHELFATAEQAGIPEDLLLPRLAEGIAKKVPAQRIAATLRREIADLVEARSVLVAVEAEELVAEAATWARAANLLDAGLGEESIRSLAIAAVPRTQTFRPASTLLVSLMEWGLSEIDATALAAAAASSELAPEAYAVVLDLLIEGRVQRLDLRETVQSLLDQIPNASSARELRRAVPW
jgi:hypothetical protein